MTNQTTIDAVRMVGNLLLHHPTTGVMCRNREGTEVHVHSGQASCFCYVGACDLVDAHFYGVPEDRDFPFNRNVYYKVGKIEAYGSRVSKACDKVLGRVVGGTVWDDASPATRKRWATKLANYTGK